MENVSNKPWSDLETERLKELVKTNSRTKAIKLFAQESGKTTDAVRRKLLRIEKAERNTCVTEVEVKIPENECNGKQNIFEKIACWFRRS